MANIRTSIAVVGLLGLLGLFSVLLPTVVGAQQQASSIAGLVRDTSGAVMPGVTVEASSSALIEKVRIAVTDSEGRYTIVDLRPGSYVVTFSLTGFTTLKHDGIALSTGVTATVNADMQVGSLEETVTVSGAAPLVDTQNVRHQLVASKELLSTLPTSAMHPSNLVTLTPGFTGITPPTGQYISQAGSTYHGKAGIKVLVDGFNIENMAGAGNSSYQVNFAFVEEMVQSTSGISAEGDADGALVNVCPKECGNSFKITLNGLFSNDHLESSNLNDDLRSRGLTTSNSTRKIYDEAITVGGPIVKDKLWFVGGVRSWGFRREIAGIFGNLTQHTVLYTPDLSQPGTRWEWNDSKIVRFTYQATPRNKFSLIGDLQKVCNCGPQGAGAAPEASGGYHFLPNVLLQAGWSSPVTNRLLLEAGAASTLSHWPQFRFPGTYPSDISVSDTGLGIVYGANPTYVGYPNDSDRMAQRLAASYVTGSHNFKVGTLLEQGYRNTLTATNDPSIPISYVFRNQVPLSIIQRSTPYTTFDRFRS